MTATYAWVGKFWPPESDQKCRSTDKRCAGRPLAGKQPVYLNALLPAERTFRPEHGLPRSARRRAGYRARPCRGRWDRGSYAPLAHTGDGRARLAVGAGSDAPNRGRSRPGPGETSLPTRARRRTARHRRRAHVFDFSGQVVVITGAAAGIGFGIAQAFHEAGARVALGDLRAPALARAAMR